MDRIEAKTKSGCFLPKDVVRHNQLPKTTQIYDFFCGVAPKSFSRLKIIPAVIIPKFLIYC